MNIGARSRRPARAGVMRGTASVLATAILAITIPASFTPAQAKAGAPAPVAGTPAVLAVADRPARALPVAAVADRPARAVPVAAVDCRRAKCVALTFDDGPGRHTDALLRHLASYRAKATFFVVGQNVAANPGIVRRTYAAGHEIGSHTWSHPDLTKLSAAGVRSQLARTDRAIRAATGVTPKLVRPPYGALNRTVRLQTRRPMVLWSVDTLDWRFRDSARVARKAVTSVRPGSVILFHDIHPSTVQAMPAVLRSLSKRGYTFVTVSQLYRNHPPRLVF
ncbi:Peptidoglycan/xylan/chitin deacetylase, PgdA/CDA1 family [Nonomuraea solani]|uniref:Peptidoglycan/xylan/chitin deacetylase, PgdA/CDA1 family n=1 Tax=Nonomuraea solani TaxID=1144553 RepID=A0A1H5UTP2_9ACTN|nr:polysaccharide deacetylase family protein [Nonomuraea solani]SEF78366.1 Peptidoglycan/xylan/chitin deacetylase, PgdA/CDA1 family [Nonomuraea solani]